MCERNRLLWVWLSLYLSSTCQLKLFPTISVAPLCLHCAVSLPGSLYPSNAFPALPCRLRPHHTSNLQNHFFPFNVGGGGGGAEGWGAKRPGGRSALAWQATLTEAKETCTRLPCPPWACVHGWPRAQSVQGSLPRLHTSTGPGCLRCCCRSWTLCSSFFWWPARVTPRAGRSLGGKERVKSGPASPRPQA